MADSNEQILMSEIVERMQLIRTANTYVNAQGATVNYQTEIGERVEEGRPNWQQEELPAISVFPGTVTIDPDMTGDERKIVCRIFPVMIRCSLVAEDTAAATAAMVRKALSDIHAAIRIDTLWSVGTSPQAQSTNEISHGPEYTEDSYEIVGTQTAIEIRYFAPHFSMED